MLEPVREQPGIDVTLDQIGALQRHLGHAHGGVEGPEWAIEHALIVRGVLADGQGQ
ncbi:hypothetical protein D3C85_1468830 [compost metagenome]